MTPGLSYLELKMHNSIRGFWKFCICIMEILGIMASWKGMLLNGFINLRIGRELLPVTIVAVIHMSEGFKN